MPRKPATPEEFAIRLDTDLFPYDLRPAPAGVRRWFTRNILEYTLSLLQGWTGKRPVLLAANEMGHLKVAVASTAYTCQLVVAGTAGDAYGIDIVLARLTSRLDVFIWDNTVMFKRSSDGITWCPEYEIPPGCYTMDTLTKAFNIRNKTAGAVARYQVIGYF